MTTQRRFSCTEAGCGKAFYRSEHLSRHRLNHRPKQVFQCASCPKQFVRKDLLQRHEKRHERGMWFRNSGGVVNAPDAETDAGDSLSPEQQQPPPPPPPPPQPPPPPSFAAVIPNAPPAPSAPSSSSPFGTAPDATDDVSGIKAPNVPGLLHVQPPPQDEFGHASVSAPRADGSGLMVGPVDVPPPLASPSSSSSRTADGMAMGMGMAGRCNSLFLDPSAELQQPLYDDMGWLLEGAADTLSPMDTMEFKGLPSPHSSLFFPPAATAAPAPPPPYPTTQQRTIPPPLAASGVPTNPNFSLPNTAATTAVPTAFPGPWSVVRSRVLSALCSLPSDVLESSFFAPANLAEFYETYFAHYDTHFPILHRPTLHPAEAPPLLIIAIVTLGATLSPDINHFRIATRIHDGLRWIVFGTGTFEPPAPLWCLQTLLILQAQEKMFSTRKHHEMAHIFHGSIITLMKRGTAYSTIANQAEQPRTDLEQSWLRWVSNEASKRTAFFAFLMDAQHTFLFGHTSVLSPHDVQLNLPCTDALWQQQTPQDWDRVMHQTPEPPSFLHTLKGLLAKNPVPSTCSSYSRLILLHGLFSVIANLHARELATLGVGRPTSSSDDAGPTTTSSSGTPPNASTTPYAMDVWKDILERAIDTWSFSLLSRDTSLSLQAARTLHHMAHVAIHTNIIDFHIVAGAPPLLGSTLSRSDCAKAKNRVRVWSKRPEAKKALYHCLRLVQDTVFTGRKYRASEDDIALRSWCLYHATLVLWAYGYMVAESDAAENKSRRESGAELSKPPSTKRRRVLTNRQVSAPSSSSLGGRVDPSLLAADENARSDVRMDGRKDSVAFGAEKYLVRMLMLLKGGTTADPTNNNNDSSSSSNANSTKASTDVPKRSPSDSTMDASNPDATSEKYNILSGPGPTEGANQTRDLILFVRESLENCRWELIQEAYDTLGRLVGIPTARGSGPTGAAAAAANPNATTATPNINANASVSPTAGVLPVTAGGTPVTAPSMAEGAHISSLPGSAPRSGMVSAAPPTMGTWR